MAAERRIEERGLKEEEAACGFAMTNDEIRMTKK